MMHGKYVIVYSRSLNSDQSYGSFETYNPSLTEKNIEIFPLGPKTPPRGGKGQVYSGDWAEVEIEFNNYFCLFKVHQQFSHNGTVAMCTVGNQKIREGDQSSMLDRVLKFGTRKTGSSVSFGMKYMRTIEDHGKWAYLGFEFIALNLATWNAATNEMTHRLVVGIKIPAKKDVASGFLLNQSKYNSERELNCLFPPLNINAPHVVNDPVNIANISVSIVLHWPSDASYLIHQYSVPKAQVAPRKSQNKKENRKYDGKVGKSWAEKAAAYGGTFDEI